MSKSALPPAEPRSKGLQFHRTVRWLAMLALLLAALFVAGRYVLFDELDEQIRAHIETMLKSQFDGCQVQVQSARRIAGKGVLQGFNPEQLRFNRFQRLAVDVGFLALGAGDHLVLGHHLVAERVLFQVQLLAERDHVFRTDLLAKAAAHAVDVLEM